MSYISNYISCATFYVLRNIMLFVVIIDHFVLHMKTSPIIFRSVIGFTMWNWSQLSLNGVTGWDDMFRTLLQMRQQSVNLRVADSLKSASKSSTDTWIFSHKRRIFRTGESYRRGSKSSNKSTKISLRYFLQVVRYILKSIPNKDTLSSMYFYIMSLTEDT